MLTSNLISTAKAMTCSYMMLLSFTGPEVNEERDNRLHSQAQLDDSLRNITDILTELQQLDLSKYLPNTL